MGLRNYEYGECARKTTTGLHMAVIFLVNALFGICFSAWGFVLLYLVIAFLFFAWARRNSRAWHGEHRRRILVNDAAAPP